MEDIGSYYFDKITSSAKISDYLAQKGINPVKRMSDNALSYHCPLPGHSSDSTPSFRVYEKDGYQDYYCFGCKCGGSIISLYSRLENKTFKEAIRYFGANLNLDLDSKIDHIVSVFKNNLNESTPDEYAHIDSAILYSTLIYEYLEAVNHNQEDVIISDKISEKFDHFFINKDIDAINSIIEKIRPRIKQRIKLYADKQKQKEVNSLRAWSAK